MTDKGELKIPPDTQLRMITIHQQHLQKDFDYYRLLLNSHEKELAWLTIGFALSLALNYYLFVKVYNLEAKIDA